MVWPDVEVWARHVVEFRVSAFEIIMIAVAVVTEIFQAGFLYEYSQQVLTYGFQAHENLFLSSFWERPVCYGGLPCFSTRSPLITGAFCIGFTVGKAFPGSGSEYFCGNECRVGSGWTRHYNCRRVAHNSVLTLCSFFFDLYDTRLLHLQALEPVRGIYPPKPTSWALICKMVNTISALVYLFYEAVQQNVWNTGPCCVKGKSTGG